jgi:hypothetical protein
LFIASSRFAVSVGFFLAIVAAGCNNAPPFMSANTRDIAQITDLALMKAIVRQSDTLTAERRQLAVHYRETSFQFFAQTKRKVMIRASNADPSVVTITLTLVRIEVDGATFPQPTEIYVESGALRAGETISDGTLTLRFGERLLFNEQAMTFTTNLGGTFFEFHLTSVYERNGRRYASGSFHGFARNENDANDQRYILVMDGAFNLPEGESP